MGKWKILFSMLIFVISICAPQRNHQKVFTIEDYLRKLNASDSMDNSDQAETETYFEAIKETFDLYYRDEKYKNGKICKSHQNYRDIADNTFSALKDLYSQNCSYVIGNLIIAHLTNEDISFLNSIEEISGYVFIFSNNKKSISLNNLKIIRADNPFISKGQKYGLIISKNHFDNKSLEYILMPSLQVILRHNVLLYDNHGICYATTKINWNSLVRENHKSIIIEDNNNSCTFDMNQAGALSCHPSCPWYSDKQYCWANTSSSCQKINDCQYRNCSDANKCYKNDNLNTEECCHDECMGGCTGPSRNQCLACKNFNNNGVCVENCPRQMLHDGIRYIKNAQGKLAFNHICVEKCPVKFYSEHGNCVSSCSMEKTFAINQTCMPCPNGICPKICRFAEIEKNKDINYLHRKMLDRLENCTVYDGNIVINKFSIKGDQFHKLSKEEYGIREKDLLKLNKLTEIHGILKISVGDSSPWLKSLIYFRNLRTIRAEKIGSSGKVGLQITHNSHLLFLGLQSLKEVRNGNIIIKYNNKLCFTNTLNNESIRHNRMMLIEKNGADSNCTKAKCNKECDLTYGCWAPTPMFCVKCKNYLISDNKKCTSNCSKEKGYFYESTNNTNLEKHCSKCHSECIKGLNTCNGSEANQCNYGCVNFKFKGYCVPICPPQYYSDNSIDKNCLPCHSSCTDTITNSSTNICSGPGDYIGTNGCHFCNSTILNLNGDGPFNKRGEIHHLKCFNITDICPDGHFKFIIDFRSSNKFSRLQPTIANSSRIINILERWLALGTNSKLQIASVCLPCHQNCLECSDGSNYHCKRCKYFRFENRCVEKCPTDYFIRTDNKKNKFEKECEKCHDECNEGCRGPTEFNCEKCRHAKIIINQTSNEFLCNSTCGDKGQKFENSEIVCLEEHLIMGLSFYHYIGGSMIIFLFLVMTCITIAFIKSCIKKKKLFDKKMKYLNNFYDIDTETNTGVLPNMATLLLITESQLTREEIIGSGAFGVVYKGIWQPNIDTIDKTSSFLKRNLMKLSQETSIKLLVAVKILTDISDPANNRELLEEAKVMASVNHPCCLRILAVCLTAHPKLITQFMPLGCLLEFCQKYRSLINNVSLLIWAKQIACGMEYLESKGIIHCDLAARNVLVQSPRQVKITDFGLAKMLDYSQHQYEFKGGRMPIKWLAIESIRNRIFSSKSDVWSYGVTLWEMFTFGDKPFSDIKAFDILEHLEKGQRLSQPKICSIDAYTILIQCWLVDPEARPSFTELRKNFEMMANNPNRYLLIQDTQAMESFQSEWENDAQKYDDFLQALVKASHIKTDDESATLNTMEKKYIKSVKNRYREMQAVQNCFINNENYHGTNLIQNKTDSENADYTMILFKDNLNSNQTGSTWTEYSEDNVKRASNCTALTNLNSNNNDIINKILETDLSEDGYLIPDSITKKSTSNYSYLSQMGKEKSKVIYSCDENRKTPEKETLINHESSI